MSTIIKTGKTPLRKETVIQIAANTPHFTSALNATAEKAGVYEGATMLREYDDVRMVHTFTFVWYEIEC